MPLNGQFQIAIIIDKLPPSCKDFKKLRRHKTKEFSIENLITRLSIKEESRRQYPKDEVLVVSNNKKKFGTVLKPMGRPLKSRNRNVVNKINNVNSSKAPSTPINNHHLKEMKL